MKNGIIIFAYLAYIACLNVKCTTNKTSTIDHNAVDSLSDQPSNNPQDTTTVDECEQCIVLAEQSKNRVAIANVKTNQIIWEWRPSDDPNIPPANLDWFGLIDEAKPVYNKKYILLTATYGAVALVRIRDKKAVFYAYVGKGMPHSAELLPDGNIVCASSIGNKLTVFKVDTLGDPDKVYRKSIYIEFGHNVVWDKKKNVLYATSKDQLNIYTYNFNCNKPELSQKNAIPFSGTNAHDLFPVYGENALWLTTSTNIYKYDIDSQKFTLADTYFQKNVKSVSSGPEGFPIIISLPKTSYYTDEVKSFKGKLLFKEEGLKIYKARWFLNNTFSYPANDTFHLCQ